MCRDTCPARTQHRLYYCSQLTFFHRVHAHVVQVSGFKYTDANKNSGVTWTTQAMFDYLANPKKYIKGTNMAFPGFKKQQDAADVTAYLKSMS